MRKYCNGSLRELLCLMDAICMNSVAFLNQKRRGGGERSGVPRCFLRALRKPSSNTRPRPRSSSPKGRTPPRRTQTAARKSKRDSHWKKLACGLAFRRPAALALVAPHPPPGGARLPTPGAICGHSLGGGAGSESSKI